MLEECIGSSSPTTTKLETNRQSSHGQTTRKVLHGASLMGWSYSDDNGATWKYGGKLSPSRPWAVLWGDPAMTTSRAHYAWTFMSSLAFPDSKFPAGGVDGYVYSAVGGACIARSTDGGVHFQIFQCVSNTDPVPGKPDSSKGHFYDGGSMAAGPQGEIYSAFIDVDTSQVDVWRSPDGNQPFVRLAAPFPNYYAGSHPRIRVGSDGTLFVMTIIKQQTNEPSPYILSLNRFRNGAWELPRLAVTFVEAYPDVNMNASVLGAPLTVRTGPQYSFDLGTPSIDRDDSVRFMFTQKNANGWLFVRGGICDYALNSCGWYKGWTFGAAQVTQRDARRLDVFNPNVAAFPGFIGIGPRWQGTVLTRFGNSTSTLNLTRGTLGYVNGTPLAIPVDIVQELAGLLGSPRLLGRLRWVSARPSGRRSYSFHAIHDRFDARMHTALDVRRRASARSRGRLLVLNLRLRHATPPSCRLFRAGVGNGSALRDLHAPSARSE